MVKARVIHVIRFRRLNQHATRALCTCGWHSSTTTRGCTFAQLAEFIKVHTAANLTV